MALDNKITIIKNLWEDLDQDHQVLTQGEAEHHLIKDDMIIIIMEIKIINIIDNIITEEIEAKIEIKLNILQNREVKLEVILRLIQIQIQKHLKQIEVYINSKKYKMIKMYKLLIKIILTNK